MNQFHITGKITFINPKETAEGRGISITHFPDTVNDSYFKLGLLVPKDLFLRTDLKMYDFVDITGHWISISRSKIDKEKLVHVVDKFLEVVHE